MREREIRRFKTLEDPIEGFGFAVWLERHGLDLQTGLDYAAWDVRQRLSAYGVDTSVTITLERTDAD